VIKFICKEIIVIICQVLSSSSSAPEVAGIGMSIGRKGTTQGRSPGREDKPICVTLTLLAFKPAFRGNHQTNEGKLKKTSSLDPTNSLLEKYYSAKMSAHVH
jgi:hypothetical protein